MNTVINSINRIRGLLTNVSKKLNFEGSTTYNTVKD